MDPLTITTAAASLCATVFTLVKTIGAFVTTARNARNELDAVSRELISLQVCLEVLENDHKVGNDFFGNELEVPLKQVLVNIQLCCSQIDDMITRLKTNRFGRPVKWALQQKDEMNRLRSSLETHKTSLQMALQLNTVYILVKEIRRSSPPPLPGSSSAPQSNDTHSTILQISQKIDGIAQSQKNEVALRRIEEAMADLSSLVKGVASDQTSLTDLVRQGCTLAHTSLATIEYIDGVPEIETKVEQMLKNPFVDPFDEAGDVDTSMGNDNREKNKSCSMCLENLCEPHQEEFDKLQKSRKEWHLEWLSQLKQDLQILDQQKGKGNPQTSRLLSETGSSAAPSSVVGNNDIADILSDWVTNTSWWDKDGTNTVSDIRSIHTDETVTRYSTATKLQRLQVNHDSARQRNRHLFEEITELEKEKALLKEEHEQDMNRLRARLEKAQTASPSQLESLQHENEKLQLEIRQTSENMQDILLSHEQLQQEYQVECQRATKLETENASLQEIHKRDMEQLEARLLRAQANPSSSPQIESLQQSNKEMRRTALDANKSRQDMKVSYERLQQKYQSECRKAAEFLQEAAEMRLT